MMNRRRGFLLAAAVILAGALAFLFRIRHEMIDFTVNYTAGDRIRHAETLYRTQDEHYQFKYSPSCAMIYLPLSAVPLPVAKAVWFALVLGATAAMIILVRRLTIPPANPWTTIVLPALVLAKFMARELELGQINAVIAAVLLGMTVLLVQDEARRSPGKAAAAGFLWGTAMAMKPYAAIFLPYFLLKRKWNVLWPGLLVLGLSFAAPASIYGFPGNFTVHQEWIASLVKSTPGLLASQDNVSILACLLKWTGNLDVSRLVYAGVILILALAVVVFMRRGRADPGKKSLTTECGLLLLAIPLISPLGWDYTFLSSLLGVALVIVHFGDFPVFARSVLAANLAIIGLSLYDVLGRAAYAAFMNASVLTVNFFILVAALFYLRFSGKA